MEQLTARSRHPLVSSGKQGGFSMMSSLITLLLLLIVCNFCYKLIPVYIDNYNLKQVIEGLQDELKSERLSAKSLKKRIINGAIVNDMYELNPKDIKIRKRPNQFEVKLNYQVERQLMYNISLLISFADTITLDTRERE